MKIKRTEWMQVEQTTEYEITEKDVAKLNERLAAINPEFEPVTMADIAAASICDMKERKYERVHPYVHNKEYTEYLEDVLNDWIWDMGMDIEPTDVDSETYDVHVEYEF